MARYRSHPADSVIAQLRREPWRFSLEQCVRLLELSGVSPELRGERGLTFAPAEIGRLQGHACRCEALVWAARTAFYPTACWRRCRRRRRISSACLSSG